MIARAHLGTKLISCTKGANMKSITRRTVLKSVGGATVALATPAILSSRSWAADPIEVGALHDSSGSHSIYGKEMDDAVKLAVEEINAAGGVLGRQINLTAFDTGSNMQNYAQFAQRLVSSQKAAVVFGGVSSASREVIRPLFNKSKTLYFYDTFYEGGVCDKNAFVMGETPAQMIGPAMAQIIKENNVKKIYTMWADYNYGYICSTWLEKFAKENGAELVAKEFFPLDVTDFSATITKIQDAKPDLVVSGLVGGNHIGFYRQWPAAGMLGKIPLHCTVFGPWEKNLLQPAEVEGLTCSYHYFQTIDSPENKAFLDKWAAKFGADHPEIGTLAVTSYNAVNLWKQAVEKAGDLDRDKLVAALEGSISFDGPGGKMTVQPTTHHGIMSIVMARVADGKFNIIGKKENVEPLDTSAVCDLIAKPGPVYPISTMTCWARCHRQWARCFCHRRTQATHGNCGNPDSQHHRKLGAHQFGSRRHIRHDAGHELRTWRIADVGRLWCSAFPRQWHKPLDIHVHCGADIRRSCGHSD